MLSVNWIGTVLLGSLFNEVSNGIDSDVLTVSRTLFGSLIEPDKSVLTLGLLSSLFNGVFDEIGVIG